MSINIYIHRHRQIRKLYITLTRIPVIPSRGGNKELEMPRPSFPSASWSISLPRRRMLFLHWPFMGGKRVHGQCMGGIGKKKVRVRRIPGFKSIFICFSWPSNLIAILLCPLLILLFLLTLGYYILNRPFCLCMRKAWSYPVNCSLLPICWDQAVKVRQW